MPSTVKITLRLPTNTYKKLQEMTKNSDYTSVNEIIRDAIRQFLNSRK